KHDVRPINHALDKILVLNGVYFTWDKEHGGMHGMGMIAEDVNKVVPEVVGMETDGSGYAVGMDYGHLTPVLVEAIKEQQTQIVSLSSQLAEMNFDDAGNLNVTVDAAGKAEVKTKSGTLISRIGAFAELVVAKLRVGVLEVKKLIVDGVDIVEKLNKLTATVEEQQKTIDALKKEVEALKK
ncbi:hypothetical protein COT62_02785, partial [Candidatus Roizmanbacteria bacterium CG09_land_8_20_14_0_10_41_9]